MSSFPLRVGALCSVAAIIATTAVAEFPWGPPSPNRYSREFLQPNLWAIEPSPVLRDKVPLYPLTTVLPPHQYANGSGVSVVVLPQGDATQDHSTVVSAFVVKRNVDGTVEKPLSPALDPHKGTRFITITRDLLGQHLMGIIPQSPLSFVAITTRVFCRLEIDAAANIFVNGMYTIKFGHEYSIQSYTLVPSTRHLAIIGNNETAHAGAGACFAGVFDFTFGSEVARILGPLPAFTQKLQKEACVAKACAVFSPRTNELIVFSARAYLGNFSSVALTLPTGFNTAKFSEAIVVATSLGGGRVAIANGPRVAVASMSVSYLGVVSATITGMRTFEGNVTALRFLGTGDAIAVAADPEPSSAGAPSSIRTFEVSTFSNAVAVATAMTYNWSSVAGLLLYNLDIDHAVVVAQQVRQTDVGGLYDIPSAVGYSVSSNCGGVVSACIADALWSNGQLGLFKPPLCMPTYLPVDVDSQGLTSSNGNVVACPTWYSSAEVTHLTYYAVATGDIVASVRYAGFTQSTPALLGRRSSTDQLVSVMAVCRSPPPYSTYLENSFVQVIDMTKAPVMSGEPIPSTTYQSARYTDPATGATLYAYTSAYSSALESRCAIRINDGRLVDVQGVAFNSGIHMRIINESVVVVGTQVDVTRSEVVARAVLVVDRHTGNITFSNIARHVTIHLLNQSAYVLSINHTYQRNSAQLIDVSNPNSVTIHTIPDWWANVGESSSVAIADETTTRVLITTFRAAALLNLEAKRFVSAPFFLPAEHPSMKTAIITDSSNDTFAVCAKDWSKNFMVSSWRGVQVGQIVEVDCHFPLGVARGNVYTLSGRVIGERASDSRYEYFVARADFALGQAAMIPLPGRNFSASMDVVGRGGNLLLQVSGEEQIAVVALGLLDSYPLHPHACGIRGQQQQSSSSVGVGPAGEYCPYVAGVDLMAGTALWVAPNDGSIGSDPSGIIYQGAPLRVRGAENLLFTTYHTQDSRHFWHNRALTAVDIFTGDVRLRLPISIGNEVITLVSSLDETGPSISLPYGNVTFTLTSTSLRPAAPPAGFRPANGTVFPVTPAPTSPTTAAPSTPGDGLSTGAKVAIVIGCVLGLGMIIAIAARIRSRRTDGGAYQPVGGGGDDRRVQL